VFKGGGSTEPALKKPAQNYSTKNWISRQRFSGGLLGGRRTQASTLGVLGGLTGGETIGPRSNPGKRRKSEGVASFPLTTTTEKGISGEPSNFPSDKPEKKKRTKKVAKKNGVKRRFRVKIKPPQLRDCRKATWGQSAGPKKENGNREARIDKKRLLPCSRKQRSRGGHLKKPARTSLQTAIITLATGETGEWYFHGV